MSFEVAIYTDVEASEAVDGVDGFNFQAVSAGLGSVDQQHIREGLLHRIVPSWSMERAELEHPQTCAYAVHDGRHYLARGRSTGATNSGRPGNQLTQAIVTSDDGDFAPYRPAQLFGAVDWCLEKASSSHLLPWVTPLEIRPEFRTDALEEFVRVDQWATQVLPRFLTMLDDVLAPEPRKLVIVHRDLDVVMRWIALGTLFVEATAARGLQFRALVENPWRANADVVGVSPEFRVTDLAAANVLDVEARGIPTIEPSSAAMARAAWFLEHGADDALNAIEISRRWERLIGVELASAGARIVGLPNGTCERRVDWENSVVVIERLADAGASEELTLYAEELCETISTYGPSTAEEFRRAGRAIRRAHEAGVDDLASCIAVMTLEVLAARPTEAAGFFEELSNPQASLAWDSPEARDAAGGCLGELLVHVPDGALADIFAAARFIDAPVPHQSLEAAVHRLAERWVLEPSLGKSRWQGWLAGSNVLEAVATRLLQDLGMGDSHAMSSLLRGDWDFLETAVDAPLLGWLRSGRLGRLRIGGRAQQIRATARLPAEAWRIVLAGSKMPVDSRTWAAWITYHGLSDELAAHIQSLIESALASMPGDHNAPTAGDWSPVMQSVTGSADTELARLAREYAQAKGAVIAARRRIEAGSEAWPGDSVRRVSVLAPLLMHDVAWLLLNATRRSDLSKLLDATGEWGPESVRATLVGMAAGGHVLGATEYALRCRADPTEEFAGAADGALDAILRIQPDLVDLATLRPSLQRELKAYLRQRGRSHGRTRKLGRALGRRKDG